jgi:hypothetical protein
VSYSLAAPPAGRPRAISSVRVTAHFMNPKPHDFARIITSRLAIVNLAALLNGIYAADDSVRMCPMIDAEYHLAFAGQAGEPRVAVGARALGPSGPANQSGSPTARREPALPVSQAVAVVTSLVG